MKHQRQKTVEIYLDSPTPFMIEHWEKLLPDWKVPPQTIVLILLKSQLLLEGQGELIELEKDRLKERFLAWGEVFQATSQQRRFLSEIISPKDGTPQYSQEGQLIFDLVATVHHALGFDFSQTAGGCKALEHPVWQTAVYPGLFLSQATATAVQSILTEMVWK
ncbi:hypothetical protein C7H19_20300 [Aphanothece hegewaldii CCALA 016]|uniref:Methylmalonic aciduria and homocystinuria type D protein n=1 Tax=Aphanothece hegewaldii CCALA 016 TaxID=2107694 RepID=A0A2T1LT23_9CHRO|nr:methylmalonic aciduria and homocystinuria type D protein [Aphanothece hegewaldii]PSF33341.1 hypothetical protein C7H19_20300 [Aphanothece hegewaldii CCALA 016]